MDAITQAKRGRMRSHLPKWMRHGPLAAVIFSLSAAVSLWRPAAAKEEASVERPQPPSSRTVEISATSVAAPLSSNATPLTDETDPVFLQIGLGESIVAPLTPGAVDTSKAEAAAAKKNKQEALKKAVAGAYKPLFYDNNFAYIDNPLYNDWFFGDRLKQRHFNFLWNQATLDIGGQYRMRYHSEQNMRGFGLTGNDDSFLLQRTRLFANAQLSENVRVYAEMLDAVSNYEHFAPRGIEENRLDIQNLFADLTLLDGTHGNLKFRGGRQELLYGSERLVSPLDWANARRTFEGYNVSLPVIPIT